MARRPSRRQFTVTGLAAVLAGRAGEWSSSR
jgi:hypothetical protein